AYKTLQIMLAAAAERDIKNYVEYQRSLPEDVKNDVARFWKENTVKRPAESAHDIKNYWEHQNELMDGLSDNVRRYKAGQIDRWNAFKKDFDNYFEAH